MAVTEISVLSLGSLKIFTINSCLAFLFISLENHPSIAACILVPLGSYVLYYMLEQMLDKAIDILTILKVESS